MDALLRKQQVMLSYLRNDDIDGTLNSKPLVMQTSMNC